MKSTKFIVAMLIFALFCLAIFTGKPAQGAVRVGVSSGETFTYNLKGYYSSSNLTAVIPDSVKQVNDTDWYKVTITGVSGTKVAITTTWHYINGTETIQEGHVDVDTSIYDGSFWQIFASNLKPGDLVRPDGPGGITLNQTYSQSYNGSTRDTNKLSLTINYYNVNNTAETYTRNTNTEFDKQTGMLVSTWDQSNYSDYTVTITSDLIDSSVWTVPEFPVAFALPLFMITTAFAVITIKKKWINITGKKAST
jgi:hypothetical protein